MLDRSAVTCPACLYLDALQSESSGIEIETGPRVIDEESMLLREMREQERSGSVRRGRGTTRFRLRGASGAWLSEVSRRGSRAQDDPLLRVVARHLHRWENGEKETGTADADVLVLDLLAAVRMELLRREGCVEVQCSTGSIYDHSGTLSVSVTPLGERRGVELTGWQQRPQLEFRPTRSLPSPSGYESVSARTALSQIAAALGLSGSSPAMVRDAVLRLIEGHRR